MPRSDHDDLKGGGTMNKRPEDPSKPDQSETPMRRAAVLKPFDFGPAITSEISKLAHRFEAEGNAAHDLWTWLPCAKVAEGYHGDYACEHMPNHEWVMREACDLICALRDAMGETAFDLVRARMAQEIRREGWIEKPERDEES